MRLQPQHRSELPNLDIKHRCVISYLLEPATLVAHLVSVTTSIHAWTTKEAQAKVTLPPWPSGRAGPILDHFAAEIKSLRIHHYKSSLKFNRTFI